MRRDEGCRVVRRASRSCGPSSMRRRVGRPSDCSAGCCCSPVGGGRCHATARR